jgi:hypothetical protein
MESILCIIKDNKNYDQLEEGLNCWDSAVVKWSTGERVPKAYQYACMKAYSRKALREATDSTLGTSSSTARKEVRLHSMTAQER